MDPPPVFYIWIGPNMGMAQGNIRAMAVAGAFYPGDPEELSIMIDRFLKEAKDIEIGGKLRGLVVPHAGYIYSGPIAAYGYRLLKGFKDDFDRVLILGPSHYAAFMGACEAGFDGWQTPFGVIKAKSIRSIVEKEHKGLMNTYPAAHAPEHCLEVQLPFLQKTFGLDSKPEIIPILCGDVDPHTLASAVASAVDERTLIIASSDLSHYLPYKEAVKTDSVANKAVPGLDINSFEQSGDACGKTGILTLMHIAKTRGWSGKMLDYRNSGDTSGDKNAVVGYGCYAFFSPKGKSGAGGTGRNKR